jgi:hypothetical protein
MKGRGLSLSEVNKALKNLLLSKWYWNILKV